MSVQSWGDILSEYIASPRQGALVICGEWGSGKTHLFHNTFVPYVRGLQQKTLHVSLYSYGTHGRSIDDLIIQSLSGITEIDDQSKKLSTELLTNALSFFVDEKNGAGLAGAALNTISGAVKKRVVDGLSNCLICFDDLDRLPEDRMYSAWGEINYYAETRQRKVLVLVDEAKLPGGSIYNPKLEKNVWGRFSIDVNPDSALNLALQKLPRRNSENILLCAESHLLPVVRHLGVKNIRVIYMALERLLRVEDVYLSLDPGRIDIELLRLLYQKIFLCALVYHEEINAAFVISKICHGVNVFDRSLSISFNSHDKKPTVDDPNQKFIDSLPDFSSLKHSMVFVPDYLEKGILNSESVYAAVERLSIFGHPIESMYGRCLERGTLDDDAYDQYLREAIKLLSNPPKGVFPLRYYCGLIYNVMDDVRLGCGSKSEEDVESIIATGIEIVIDGMGRESHVARFDSIASSYIKVSLKLNNLLERLTVLSRQESKARRLMASISGWQEDLSLMKLREAFSDREVPSLQLIGSTELQEFLFEANADIIDRFNGLLVERYNVDGLDDIYAQEACVIRELARFMEGVKCAGLRRAMVEKVQVTLAAIVKKYSKP